MQKQLEVQNIQFSMKPIDKIIESVFQEITEEERNIACKFCLNEKDLKELCRKQKCMVQMDCANLLKGIEKKVLQKEPHLNNTKKIQTAAYKWYINHPRSSKKYCDKSFQQLTEENITQWRDRKVHDLITLGIHPKLLTTTYKKYGDFNKAVKYLEEFDLKCISSPVSSVLIYGSDSESDASKITVINTQEYEEINTSRQFVQKSENSEINTEELINLSQNYGHAQNINLVFNSQEINESNVPARIDSYVSEKIMGDIAVAKNIVESQLPQSYDQFNYDGMMLTSTQKI